MLPLGIELDLHASNLHQLVVVCFARLALWFGYDGIYCNRHDKLKNKQTKNHSTLAVWVSDAGTHRSVPDTWFRVNPGSIHCNEHDAKGQPFIHMYIPNMSNGILISHVSI